VLRHGVERCAGNSFRAGGPATLVCASASPAASCFAASNHRRESRIAYEFLLEIVERGRRGLARRVTNYRDEIAVAFLDCETICDVWNEQRFAALEADLCGQRDCDVLDAILADRRRLALDDGLVLRLDFGARSGDALIGTLAQRLDVALLCGGIFGGAARGFGGGLRAPRRFP
jgi:hypothetical protein